MNSINKLLTNTETLSGRISLGLERELKRQKQNGKLFISDNEIDTLVDEIIENELGNNHIKCMKKDIVHQGYTFTIEVKLDAKKEDNQRFHKVSINCKEISNYYISDLIDDELLITRIKNLEERALAFVEQRNSRTVLAPEERLTIFGFK